MSQTKTSFRLSLLALALLALPVMSRAQADPQNNTLATQIDNYLNGIHPKNDLRPLAGHGNNFASEGSTYNVDPRFVVAISGAETTFGAFTCSEDNAFNWFWNAGTGCHQSPFDNWDAGIHTVSHYLQKSYLLKGYTSISLIGGRYCTSGCEHWVPNVTSVYQTLGGDPNGALTFPTAVTGTTASADPTPQEPATPAVSATLTANTSTSSSTTSKSTAFIVEATFSNLTNQRLSGVELYRDVPPKPTHVVSLLRVTGSPDTAPVYRANFTLPANDTGAGLRVRGQLSLHGKSLGAVTSDPLTLPSPSSHLWLIVGIIAGALVLVIAVVVLIVMLRKRKSSPAAAKPAGTAETKPTATVTEIRPATTEAKSADKTGTTTK
jgi:hypothetical protein